MEPSKDSFDDIMDGISVTSYLHEYKEMLPSDDFEEFCFMEDPHIIAGSENTSDEEDDTSEEMFVEMDDPRNISIQGIENFVLSFLKQLTNSMEVIAANHRVGDHGSYGDIQQPSNSRKNKCQKIEKIVLRMADRRKASPSIRSIRYPLNSKGASAKPFAQLFGVLNFMHEALIDDVPVTKRDMYYKDVSLFKSQATVDRLVDDIAATFELERSHLHVRATSKGLICGSGLLIHLIGGETIYINESEGALIPVGEDIDRFEVESDITWILIVEKDAVFQTLCRLQFASHASLPGPGIIITGKGYPDIATRQLIRTLSDNLPSQIPILALVDGDAYGIDILSVYKYGSLSLRHENEKLAADRVEWIGIFASELTVLGIGLDAMIPISKHDQKKAFKMLERAPEKMPVQWRKELMRMVYTRRKAEIEILSSVNAGRISGSSDAGCPLLIRYLSNKIVGSIAALV